MQMPAFGKEEFDAFLGILITLDVNNPKSHIRTMQNKFISIISSKDEGKPILNTLISIRFD